MKKLIPIVFVIFALLLTACTGPYKGRESEVEEILRPLMEKEVALLRYLYGDGFKTMDEVSAEDANYTTTAKYYRVSEESPYHSVDELKAAIREVYTEDRAGEIESGLFENTGAFSRFNDYNILNVAGEVVGTDLGIDVTQNHPAMALTAEVRLSTVKVTRSTETIIECEIDYTDGRGGSVETMRITLISEKGEWKMDDSSWAGSVA